jgi:hypothetical protein
MFLITSPKNERTLASQLMEGLNYFCGRIGLNFGYGYLGPGESSCRANDAGLQIKNSLNQKSTSIFFRPE